MYKINNSLFNPDDLRLQQALASIYGTPMRPLCMCQREGIEMYIAKVNDSLIIKRMPHSAASHAAGCESYEPPPELSGRGQVMDGAIQTDTDEGITTLRLDFSLTKTGTKSAPTKGGDESDSVKADGKKLTLRGTLHYLYDEAGLTRWYPAMEGKRNWWIVRRALLEGAADKRTKGADLSNVVYIPESFNAEKKDEIAQRRLARFRALAANEGKARKLMLLVGEVKEIGEARFGKKMVIKHLPDCHFMMDDDLHKRFTKRFANDLTLWAGNDSSHLLVIATFGVNATGTAIIEELSAMLVDENWIPFESVDERLLVEALVQKRRKFVKGLRYNLPSSKVLASAVLNDTPEPVALYITPFGADDALKAQTQELMDASEMQSWEWYTGDAMPTFPSSSAES